MNWMQNVSSVMPWMVTPGPDLVFEKNSYLVARFQATTKASATAQLACFRRNIRLPCKTFLHTMHVLRCPALPAMAWRACRLSYLSYHSREVRNTAVSGGTRSMLAQSIGLPVLLVEAKLHIFIFQGRY